MGIETALAAAALAVTATGTAIQYGAAKKKGAAEEEALAQQQELEKKRQQQMELDASRRKRELVRNQLAARSAALATATAQGATGAGSSALEGAYGSISGRTNVNELGINQNLELGRDIFNLNEGILGSYRAAASAGSTAALGQGLTTLGNGLLSNLGTISKIGNFAFGKKSNYGDPSY